jgi:hypothetical protein
MRLAPTSRFPLGPPHFRPELFDRTVDRAVTFLIELNDICVPALRLALVGCEEPFHRLAHCRALAGGLVMALHGTAPLGLASEFDEPQVAEDLNVVPDGPRRLPELLCELLGACDGFGNLATIFRRSGWFSALSTSASGRVRGMPGWYVTDLVTTRSARSPQAP